MPRKSKKFIPENTFDVNIKIKDLNYTNDLVGIKVLSSAMTPYQIVELDLRLDPTDIILENVYGKDPIKINIRSKSQNGEILDQIDMDLMMLDTSYSMTNKTQISDSKEKEEQSFSIKTVCRKPFESMMCIVNGVYQQTTLKDVLSDLVQSQAGASLKFDSKDQNTTTIPQLLVPPNTLHKIIKENSNSDRLDGYLDQQFGYFDGVPLVFCKYDNTVYIKNLTGKIKSGSKLIIHQLGTDKDNNDIIKQTTDGKTFYTYSPINNNYTGNKKISILANDVHYITKPPDKLYDELTFKMDSIANKYSLNSGDKKVQMSKTVKDRKKYNVSSRYSNQGSKTFAHSELSRIISDLSTIEINLYGSFQITNLLEIGEAVKLKPQTSEYSKLSGNYILSNSIVELNRGDNSTGTQWHTSANLKLMRTMV